MTTVARLTRRAFGGLVGAAMLAPAFGGTDVTGNRLFRIRTITAGIAPASTGDFGALAAAADFLRGARERYEAAGHEVQSLRVATTPLGQWLPEWEDPAAIDAIDALSRAARAEGVALALGPVIAEDRYSAGFAPFAARIAALEAAPSFSLSVASPEHGVHRATIRAAGEAVAAIAAATPGGEGNFNFTATGHQPAGTPFFPAAFHDGGAPAFAIGLETPDLLMQALDGLADMADAGPAIREALDAALAPLAELGREIAGASGRRWLGIDASPAPSPDASIGAVIERIAGVPFGGPGTAAACAAVTGALRTLAVETCGYSGLMLPVLEDRVLAARAAEGRFRVADLLLFSSVCGTGLDVVPLPGDTSAATLAAIVGDVAALAHRYGKPLSARLLPLPGMRAGEPTRLGHPMLVDSVAMAAG